MHSSVMRAFSPLVKHFCGGTDWNVSFHWSVHLCQGSSLFHQVLKSKKMKAIAVGLSQGHRLLALISVILSLSFGCHFTLPLQGQIIQRKGIHGIVAQVNTTTRRVIMLWGTVPSASDRQRFVANSIIFSRLKDEESLLQKLHPAFLLWHECFVLWQSVWKCSIGVYDVCSQTVEQDWRIWEPLIAALLVRWLKSYMRLSSSSVLKLIVGRDVYFV